MKILMKLRLNEFEIYKKNKCDFIVSNLQTEEDEKSWEKLISKVFSFQCNIEENLKNEEIYSPERVFIIKYRDRVIATASAWYREKYGVENGYLHMVAVDELYRGKGLSFLVVNKAIEYMKNEGRKNVVLLTDDFRENAIGLYKKIGFKEIIME